MISGAEIRQSRIGTRSSFPPRPRQPSACECSISSFKFAAGASLIGTASTSAPASSGVPHMLILVLSRSHPAHWRLNTTTPRQGELSRCPGYRAFLRLEYSTMTSAQKIFKTPSTATRFLDCLDYGLRLGRTAWGLQCQYLECPRG